MVPRREVILVSDVRRRQDRKQEGAEKGENERGRGRERELPIITDKALNIQVDLKHEDKTATLIS